VPVHQWPAICAQRRQECLASLVGADREVPLEFLESLSRRLASGEYALTAEIVRVLAHEEELRQRLEGLLRESPAFSPEGQVLSFFGEQLSPALGFGGGPPKALLRPCLELLQLPSLPVASGLQYEAANILSRLRDSRCAGTLRRLLAATPAVHTNLRCATIFALGCLKDPDARELYTDILRGPDVVTIAHGDLPTAYQQPLHREKSEAIWALGKLQEQTLPALSLLSRFAEHPDRELRVAAAWA
ncbi:MAG: HEAT repeat domain-containing protein, partial [Candidatus Oleimicrobiaceae bacterium]